MAEAILKKITDNMKCNLCHELLFNPKTLPCRHTYCNGCLDAIVVFQNNGSATLQCPEECKGNANVDAMSSVNSTLASSFELQRVLNSVKEETIQK